ncbi:transporter substrate-binding domain-containing protein [Niveispirillum sp.]|uniref:transporter substrate-binding domain-containing protein n=1 Tax=Niveispirillum sp. TaxID=1917217 RepID=UPI001B4C0AAE|nr:transporter substrate-binding domain-containing protein [Niveispirillum sp.]MBP7339223.1 transporter substrate-binding domain-containing protein [Niveispirillum sp.]
MRWLTMLLLSLAMLAPAMVRAEDQRVRTYRVEHNASPAGHNVRSFYLDLIEKVLMETSAEFGPARLQNVPEDVPQARLLAQLAHNRLDLLWTTTNRLREGLVTPIHIPLDMGLTGQRALVIRADRKAEFDKITKLEQLSQMKACQGAYWPDTVVLRAAGLRVVEFDWIDMAYPGLYDGRCDYLPRALNEIDGEVASIGDKGVIVYDRLLLSYALPMYLFVAPAQTELARRMQTGLEKMVASGELRRFMESHPSTSMIFPLTRFQGARIFHLANPDLPEETPLDDKRLWLDVETEANPRPKS